jgi:hypothetical protein
MDPYVVDSKKNCTHHCHADSSSWLPGLGIHGLQQSFQRIRGEVGQLLNDILIAGALLLKWVNDNKSLGVGSALGKGGSNTSNCAGNCELPARYRKLCTVYSKT